MLRGQDASESGRRHIYFAYGVCGSQQSAWFVSDAGKWEGLVSFGVCDLSVPFGLQVCLCRCVVNRRLVTASNTFVLSFGMYKVRIGCIVLAVGVGSVWSCLEVKFWRVFSCASLCGEGQVG